MLKFVRNFLVLIHIFLCILGAICGVIIQVKQYFKKVNGNNCISEGCMIYRKMLILNNIS